METAQDPKQLQRMLEAQEARNRELEQTIQTLEENLKKLEEILKNTEEVLKNKEETILFLTRQKYGRKSEKTEALKSSYGEQLSFLFDEAEATTAQAQKEQKEAEEMVTVATHKRKKRAFRERIDANVKHEKRLVKVEDDHCDVCGHELVTVGEKLVRSEVKFVPASLTVYDYYQEVKQCKACCEEERKGAFKEAKMPQPLLPHSMASPSLVTEVIIDKYDMATPLYRQERKWKAAGLDVGRDTLANWIIRTDHYWLKPLMEELRKSLLAEDVIHADETPVQVLGEKDRTNAQKSYMWVFTTGERTKKPIRFFLYAPSRAGAIPNNFLEGYQELLQCDSYVAYNKVLGVRKQAACWAHLRRKFVESLLRGKTENDGSAGEAVKQINAIFRLEKDWQELPPEDLLKLRQEKEKPLVEAFFCWAHKEIGHPSPKSKLGTALTYALNHEAEFKVYLSEPSLALTNNIAENAIRPFVIGRKNWLFSGSPKGAKASADLYSLIQTAKANGLDARKYILFLLEGLPQLGDRPKPEALAPFLPWSEEAQATCH